MRRRPKTVPVKKANPEYIRWVTRDQALLGYLLSSLTRETLMGVTTLTSSAKVWLTLESMFGSPTQVRSIKAISNGCFIWRPRTKIGRKEAENTLQRGDPLHSASHASRDRGIGWLERSPDIVHAMRKETEHLPRPPLAAFLVHLRPHRAQQIHAEPEPSWFLLTLGK
jgi:hypothetical protein